jgi:hypothetical protein
VLIECGLVRAVAGDGAEFVFRPSFGRIAALGAPHEIVELYAGLHGPDAGPKAAYVLACLCDQDDATPLIGWRDETGWHVGGMPEAEQIIIARHLMRHGIIGKAKPAKRGEGKFSDSFDAAEYIAAARVHLGLSSADAEALSMTEFQTMMEMKFPEVNKARDVATREEYGAAMAAIKERRRGN